MLLNLLPIDISIVVLLFGPRPVNFAAFFTSCSFLFSQAHVCCLLVSEIPRFGIKHRNLSESRDPVLRPPKARFISMLMEWLSISKDDLRRAVHSCKVFDDFTNHILR